MFGKITGYFSGSSPVLKHYSTKCLFSSDQRDLLILPDKSKTTEMAQNIYKNIQSVSGEMAIKFYSLNNFKVDIEYIFKWTLESYIEVLGTRHKRELDAVYQCPSLSNKLKTGKHMTFGKRDGFYVYSRMSYQAVDFEEFETGDRLRARAEQTTRVNQKGIATI